MSLYQGATWNTEIDVAHLARPDSLLAFHVEPMLLAFVPFYAVGAGPVLLLIVQALAVGLGAVPAYRLGRHFGRSPWSGTAVALAYLLSPLGQSAVLADFHTSTLAAPLLLLAAERMLIAHQPIASIAAASVALTAREDVGPAVILLALSMWALGAPRKPALLMAALAVAWTALAVTTLAAYSGGASAFAVRYGAIASAGLSGMLSALTRPADLTAFTTVLLSGAWLAAWSPIALVPALPTLLSNALSSSPWMAAGKAHYAVLVLPFVAIAAAAGLRRIPLPARPIASAALVLGASIAYLAQGAGPLAADYAPATVTEHARLAASLADGLPSDAAVSASSPLVPRLSHRSTLYVFPAVLNAEYVFVDLRASSAPTSPGDVFLRIRDLLANGGWEVTAASDGLLVLHRNDAAPALSIEDLSTDWLAGVNADPQGEYGPLRLLHAELLPSPDGALDVDGPRGILRTTWRADQPVPPGTRLEFWLDLREGRQLHVWDIAALWWYPPERWTPGQAVTVDISDGPLRHFLSWQALASQR
jgi:uncharacterized membrane protein